MLSSSCGYHTIVLTGTRPIVAAASTRTRARRRIRSVRSVTDLCVCLSRTHARFRPPYRSPPTYPVSGPGVLYHFLPLPPMAETCLVAHPNSEIGSVRSPGPDSAPRRFHPQCRFACHMCFWNVNKTCRFSGDHSVLPNITPATRIKSVRFHVNVVVRSWSQVCVVSNWQTYRIICWKEVFSLIVGEAPGSKWEFWDYFFYLKPIEFTSKSS